ncbi:MAG TPA: cation:proton antiporter [Candidatus Polarisedimenticolaceae bacterium]|nr:cation:proton antiporter [Candidatus Polarisedimenticolaceae bacterium]
MATVVLSIAVILVVAKLAGDLAVRLRQPAVLGELVGGVILGNLSLLGLDAVEPMKTDASLAMLAEIGVLILLFEVGLESTVRQMLRVGVSSLAVAVLGVVAPFALGWAVAAWLLPDHSLYLHMFIGATLCATSVGITARVLRDLGESQSDEARIVLGAAVIDDVLGLVILAVVTGVVTAADSGGTMSFASVGIILAKAVAFLFGALWLGLLLFPRFLVLAARLKAPGAALAFGLTFCFVLSWAAHAIGLAPIVGAFAAGLILEDVHFKELREKGEHPLEESIHPISAFLVPIFFVLMGMHTDLRAFADASVLALAAALTLAAIVGKQACSLGVAGGADRLSVGIGMIPRGEVGLIFASMGLALSVRGEPLVDAAIYSAIVIMVIVTTLVTPPALKWSLARRRKTA